MRLDILITKKKLVKSRNQATERIKAGEVKVNGEIVTKIAKDFPENTKIEILSQPKYVGRGGLKLEKALDYFLINPANLVILDVGASTGGFTDCLLQRNAKKVYAVDVGINQLDDKLRKDPRVVFYEKTDIRNIDTLPEKPVLAVIDVSFISLEMILKKVADLIETHGQIIALIKPQFETGREEKNKNGVVKDDRVREKTIKKIEIFCQKNNLKATKTIDSPILGGSGNKEYLMLIQK